jgi:glycosyltransferase involved in cell wall biosynthesis
MSKKPQFSIITPGFNQLEYLKTCAKSVADQRNGVQVEHLIQEGFGGKEMEEWAANQQGADVFVEKDNGMYDAINRGVKRSRGAILAWLNCDEQYLPGTLSKVWEWFEERPDHDILFGDTVLISSNAEPLAYRKAVVPRMSEIKHVFLSTYSASTFVRRQVFEDGFYLDDRMRAVADADWILRLLASGYRAGVLNEPLAAFVQDGKNMGQSAEGKTEASRWRGQDKPKGKVCRLFHTPLFRIRRLIRGCYSARHFESSIYRQGQEERSRISGVIWGRWKAK